MPIKTPVKKTRAPPMHDLDDGDAQGRVHEPVADPGDHAQLDDHDGDGHGGGRLDGWDQIGKRVPEPAQGRHQSADQAAGQRMAAAGQRAVIRERFGKPHADSRTDAGGHTDQKRLPALMSRKGRGEDGGECRDRSVHQPGEPGLDHLEQEQPALGGRFLFSAPVARRASCSSSARSAWRRSSAARSPRSWRIPASLVRRAAAS